MVSELSAERVYTRLSTAAEAVGRLDERVAACAFAQGFAARRDMAEAVAWSWTQGWPTPLEDLVLRDQDMDARTPNQGLLAAYDLVLARRKARLAGPELLSQDGGRWLLGRGRKPPSPAGGLIQTDGPSDPDRPSQLERLERALGELEARESTNPERGLVEWLDFAGGLDRRAPPLLRAAAMLEAWWIVDPSPRHRHVGAILVSRWLTIIGLVRSHELGLEVGLRLIGRGRGAEMRSGDPLRRIGFWLMVIERAANDAVEELQRLEFGRQVMTQQVAGRRSHARAGDVMRLLLDHPVVTAPFIAERLGISQQGARRSLEELGSVVQEVSGRSRFRAWRV